MEEPISVRIGDTGQASERLEQDNKGLGQAVGEAALRTDDPSDGNRTVGTSDIEPSNEEVVEPDLNGISSLEDLLKATGVDESKLSSETETERATREAIERREEQQKQELVRYQEFIESIATKQEAYRKASLQRLAQRIESGKLTREAAEREFANIEVSVKKSAEYSYAYNRSSDPKYYRSQSYTAFVDDDGNIWGDYERARSDYGQPVSAGLHLIMENPDKPLMGHWLSGPVVRREGE